MASPLNAFPASLHAVRIALAVALVVSAGSPRTSLGAEDTSATVLLGELNEILGEGVVEPTQAGALDASRPLGDPLIRARWEPGEWTYRITSGARRGTTISETLAPIDTTGNGKTWRRTIGEEYTLYVSQAADGSLVVPSEIAHAHKALVRFDPPLAYLMAELEPGATRVFDGRMEVYRARHPDSKLYSGRIRATTALAGSYRVKTPAGTFDATLVRTDYKIDIFALVSVTDTLYTFYAEGIGKVAEAGRQRMSAMGLLDTNTQIGKVLLRFTPATIPPSIQSP
jgi:hypothetical protein